MKNLLNNTSCCHCTVFVGIHFTIVQSAFSRVVNAYRIDYSEYCIMTTEILCIVLICLCTIPLYFGIRWWY